MAISAVSATTTTETQYPVVINGYTCYSAAEVRAARQFQDPRTVNPLTQSMMAPSTGTASVSNSNSSTNTAASAAVTGSAATPASTNRSSSLDNLQTYNASGTRDTNSQTDSTDSTRRGSVLDIYA